MWVTVNVDVEVDLFDIDDRDLIEELRERDYVILKTTQAMEIRKNWMEYDFLNSEDPMQISLF